jgi:Secretion system C-terminal sorting domain
MKKIILIFLLASSLVSNAQNPIFVQITQDCDFVTGSFNFESILNGKNNYSRIVTFMGQTSTIRLGFNGTIWILYNELDLNDIGFFNANNPAGLLPPTTGWQPNPPNGCDVGTMTVIVNGILSKEDFAIDSFNISPNPATNYLKINNNQEKINYEVLDINGRIIINGIALETIDISNLNSGMYFLKINSNIKKFIKI